MTSGDGSETPHTKCQTRRYAVTVVVVTLDIWDISKRAANSILCTNPSCDFPCQSCDRHGPTVVATIRRVVT